MLNAYTQLDASRSVVRQHFEYNICGMIVKSVSPLVDILQFHPLATARNA